MDYYFEMKQVRKHNRQIHKMTVNKGYRLFDKVKCKGEVGFIWARRKVEVSMFVGWMAQ